MSMQRQFKTVRLPLELCERIDAAAGGVPRERWVRRVLERALDGVASPVAGPDDLNALIEQLAAARDAKVYAADEPPPPTEPAPLSFRRGSVSPSLGRFGGPQS